MTGQPSTPNSHATPPLLPDQNDPVWRSPPRIFMKRTAKQTTSQPPESPTSKSNTHYRYPQCNHSTMTRLFGKHICHVCEKVPSLGFVYLCEQDHLPEIRGSNSSIEALPLVSDHGNFFEAQAEIARSLGMSTSVIRQMRAGDYSYEQIELLLAQRRRVKEVIKQRRNSSKSKDDSPTSDEVTGKQIPPQASENIIASAGLAIAKVIHNVGAEKLLMSPAGTPDNTPSASMSNSPSRKPKEIKCNFQVCHACRPYFHDRTTMSLGAVLHDEIPAMTAEDLKKLRVCDPKIVSNIGLRETSQKISTGLSKTNRDEPGNDGQEDFTEDSASTSSSLSVEVSEASDVFPCPGAGICPVFIPSQGCAYDHGFDDGQRAINHSFAADQDLDSSATTMSTTALRYLARGSTEDTPCGSISSASSISLPDLLTEPLTPITPRGSSLGAARKRDGKAASVYGVVCERVSHYRFPVVGFVRNDSNSSLSSEVEVEGGVALTEEAVETGAPDIVTDRE